jgi:hypothetical protein
MTHPSGHALLLCLIFTRARMHADTARNHQLPTWNAGVSGPFGEPVKFYFRRHLERVRGLLVPCCSSVAMTRDARTLLQAAAQKHGAAGVDGARQKQAERKVTRQKNKEDKKARACVVSSSSVQSLSAAAALTRTRARSFPTRSWRTRTVWWRC